MENFDDKNSLDLYSNKENENSNFLNLYSTIFNQKKNKKTINQSSFNISISRFKDRNKKINVKEELFTIYMKNIKSINKKILHINDSCFGKKNPSFSFINSPPISLKYLNNFKKEITSFSPTSYKRNINYYFLSDIMRADFTFNKKNFYLNKSNIKIVPLKEVMKKKENDNYEKFLKDLEIPKNKSKKRNLTSFF